MVGEVRWGSNRQADLGGGGMSLIDLALVGGSAAAGLGSAIVLSRVARIFTSGPASHAGNVLRFARLEQQDAYGDADAEEQQRRDGERDHDTRGRLG